MNCCITELIKYMPPRFRDIFLNMELEIIERIREIRIKVMCPVLLYVDNKLYSLSSKSKLTDVSSGITVYEEDVSYTYDMLIRESVYAFTDQIINCYVTTDCGHRAGISGTAVMKNGEIIGLKDINGIYFRIAREHVGCANELLNQIIISDSISNTLIAASPGKGKTTLLRDVACKLSKKGYKVSIIDERHEIAAMNCGYSSFDIGFCDVLDGFPKAEGIERAVRTLSPDVVIFDELGNDKEAEAVAYALNCGVSFITSVHSGSIKELMNRPIVRNLTDINAVDTAVLYDLGKIREIKHFKGEQDVKSACFELDFRHVCNDGNY